MMTNSRSLCLLDVLCVASGGVSLGWCRVLSVEAHGEGEVYGNFTDNHLLMATGSGVVSQQGRYSTQRSVDLVNVATDCAVAVTTGGQLFTPLSSTFCGTDASLSLSQYVVASTFVKLVCRIASVSHACDFLRRANAGSSMSRCRYVTLYAAILRVAAKTGTFWFAPDTYTRTTNDSGWHSDLPPLCASMLACIASGSHNGSDGGSSSGGCDHFEANVTYLVNTHMVTDAASVVLVRPFRGIANHDNVHSCCCCLLLAAAAAAAMIVGFDVARSAVVNTFAVAFCSNIMCPSERVSKPRQRVVARVCLCGS